MGALVNFSIDDANAELENSKHRKEEEEAWYERYGPPGFQMYKFAGTIPVPATHEDLVRDFLGRSAVLSREVGWMITDLDNIQVLYLADEEAHPTRFFNSRMSGREL